MMKNAHSKHNKLSQCGVNAGHLLGSTQGLKRIMCHLQCWTNITPMLLLVFPAKHILTLSSLNLPLSSSSITSRELLSQFPTCSGWRWLEVGEKLRKLPCIVKSFMDVFFPKPLSFSKIKSFFRYVKWCFDASWGLEGLKYHCKV